MARVKTASTTSRSTNENIVMPAMPEGAEAGILKGMYKLSSKDAGAKAPRVAFARQRDDLQYAQAAQEQLAEFGVSSDVYSVTSYKELRKDAQGAETLEPAAPRIRPEDLVRAGSPRRFGRPDRGR